MVKLSKSDKKRILNSYAEQVMEEEFFSLPICTFLIENNEHTSIREQFDEYLTNEGILIRHDQSILSVYFDDKGSYDFEAANMFRIWVLEDFLNTI